MNEYTSKTRDGQARWALIAFVVVQLVAIIVLLYLGRHRWFRFDDWDFVSARSVTSVRDLFEPHNVHWSTVPIVIYRLIWRLFGLVYIPYQLLGILIHLVLAGLICLVMLRAGVRQWSATLAAIFFVLLGAGEENILWAFSAITFTLTLALGLTHLLLADHDGGVDRRDWIGLLAGLGALMSSGVAVTIAMVVGLAVLMRRGWRMAVFHTVPLALVFSVWYFAIGVESFRQQDRRSLGETWGFFRAVTAETYTGLARVPALAWVLGAFVAAGLLLAWHGKTRDYLRTHASPTVAMLVGAFVFLLIIGTSRSEEDATATRYVHTAATLTLPAVAVAADAVTRRWRATAPIIVVLVVASLTANVRDFQRPERVDQFVRDYRQGMLTFPRLPIASEVPGELRPDTGLAPWVTIGWLRDGVASGRIPEPGPSDRTAIATSELRLALRRTIRYSPTHCEPVSSPIEVQLTAGESIRSPAETRIVYTSPSGVESAPVEYEASVAQYLVAFADLERIRIEPLPASAELELCDMRGDVGTILGEGP